jgi:hypothetical protein
MYVIPGKYGPIKTVGWSYTAFAALDEEEMLFLRLIGELEEYEADDFKDHNP